LGPNKFSSFVPRFGGTQILVVVIGASVWLACGKGDTMVWWRW